jgi:6-pyruvoyltetrahydropterin/6-carboxytetrahydropterin synthase
MYSISVETGFDAGHYLLLPGGQKEVPHHHQWCVEAIVEATSLDKNGLIMDFHDLRAYLDGVVEPLTLPDYINDLPQFKEINPSAEQLARYIYEKLTDKLAGRVQLKEVRVFEAQGCWAGYRA